MPISSTIVFLLLMSQVWKIYSLTHYFIQKNVTETCHRMCLMRRAEKFCSRGQRHVIKWQLYCQCYKKHIQDAEKSLRRTRLIFLAVGKVSFIQEVTLKLSIRGGQVSYRGRVGATAPNTPARRAVLPLASLEHWSLWWQQWEIGLGSKSHAQWGPWSLYWRTWTPSTRKEVII